MGSFVTCRRRLSVSRRSATPVSYTHLDVYKRQHLILTNGCTLTAEKGIVVTSTNSLTIYAQSENGGTLNATGTTDDSGNASAGIGGSTDSLNSGAITIHGGVINATGGSTGSNGYGGAGIGGGTSKSANGGNSGTIIIYGGTVTANNGARCV